MFGRKRRLLDICEVTELATKALFNSKKIDKAIRKIEKKIKEKAKEGKWEVRFDYGPDYEGLLLTKYQPGYTADEAKCIIQILENGGYKVKRAFEPKDDLANCYKELIISWEHMKPQGTVLN